jgi:hypothetical protein
MTSLYLILDSFFLISSPTHTSHAIQPHLNENPEFEPRDGSPIIHVNIRNSRDQNEMNKIWAEHVEQTRLAEEKQAQNPIETSSKLVGEKKYDLTVKTTYEYDVVECKDFVEDEGCWVRNMPEEIKRLNPNFVPT